MRLSLFFEPSFIGHKLCLIQAKFSSVRQCSCVVRPKASFQKLLKSILIPCQTVTTQYTFRQKALKTLLEVLASFVCGIALWDIARVVSNMAADSSLELEDLLIEIDCLSLKGNSSHSLKTAKVRMIITNLIISLIII